MKNQGMGEFPFMVRGPGATFKNMQNVATAAGQINTLSTEQIISQGGIPTVLVSNSPETEAARGYDAVALNELIDRFNRYFNVVPATREMLFYVNQVYHEIFDTYGEFLSAAQVEGLQVKMIAYQDRVRRIEAGMADPYTPGDTVAIDAPAGGLPLPGVDGSVTVMGQSIPMKWIYGVGAAVLAGLLLKGK